MAKAVLHQGQQLGIVLRFRVKHAGRIEACLEKPRSEQVSRPHHPQHRPVRPRCNAGDEQSRGGIVAPVCALSGDFVQRIAANPAIGQPQIDRIDAEREQRSMATGAFHRTQRLAKIG